MQVCTFMENASIKPAGPSIAVYYTNDPEKLVFRSGFTIAREDMIKASGDIKADVTPAASAVHFVHKGSYATLRDDYELMMAHIMSNNLKMGVPTWELYLNDPSTTPEEELVTECYPSLA